MVKNEPYLRLASTTLINDSNETKLHQRHDKIKPDHFQAELLDEPLDELTLTATFNTLDEVLDNINHGKLQHP